MIGFYNYTVWLTYLSLISGSLGIYFALSENPLAATICLGISGLLDLFDGKVARTKKDRTEDQKKFGIQIDSLSDLVCFGVLPSAIGYALGMRQWYFIFVFAFFILAGMIRLAYFNVMEEHRQEEGGKPYFYGMPITFSSMIVPLFFILSRLIHEGFPYIYSTLLIVLGLFFLIKVKVPKPSAKVSFIYSGILLVLYVVGFILLCTR